MADLRHEDHRFFRKTLYTKATGWHYEKEWRMFWPHQCLLEVDGIIGPVILGLNFPPEMLDEIIAICRNKGVKLLRCRKTPGRYAMQHLDTEPIAQ